jgi:hypothetical protein
MMRQIQSTTSRYSAQLMIGIGCSALSMIFACGDSSPREGTADAAGPGGPPFDLPIYIQPTQVCRAPLEGEPPGKSPGAQVCTWQSVAGATEEGRRFQDYGSCEVVRTQRPYYPMPPNPTYLPDDARMQDPMYVAELTWVRKQIEAVGCACCHSAAAPKGPVRWSIDLPGNWSTAMSDRDVAAVSNWIDTSLFEKYPAAINNGFSRPHGLPSTNPDRIEAFFAAEAAHRGLTKDQFASAPPTGGPLIEQTSYVPQPCTNGEGVNAAGMIQWEGGPARYIYVLDVGSKKPTVPPDRDTPDGTVWRVDVPAMGQPLLPAMVQYGVLPMSTLQHFPSTGSPVALTAGRDYYLYVTRDMFQPITRCIFTMP